MTDKVWYQTDVSDNDISYTDIGGNNISCINIGYISMIELVFFSRTTISYAYS